jgi:hypothetical protein
MKDRILYARSVFQFLETKVGFCHAHGVPVGWSVFYRMLQQSSSRSFFEYMTEKPKSVFENIMVLKNRGRLFSIREEGYRNLTIVLWVASNQPSNGATRALFGPLAILKQVRC